MAEIVAVIVWLAFGLGDDRSQFITIGIAWPLALMGARQARANGWTIVRRPKARSRYM